jgi:uncharacterized protein (DUF488 family)
MIQTPSLFTIGYSCQTPDSLLALLKKYNVTALADVRSLPFSKYKPEFNHDTFSHFLKTHGIQYVFLGEECGARTKALECYVNGKADYRLIAQHALFKNGLNRIREGLLKHTLALMCSEKDPLQCHRSILVCRNLRSKKINIQHILCNGDILSHQKLEAMLLDIFNFKHGKDDFFLTNEMKLNLAYDYQADAIAYVEKKWPVQTNTLGAVDGTPIYHRIHKKISA